jgi:hypothetical protein
LSYGYELPGSGLAFGGSAKLVESTINSTQARALAIDGGALYRRGALAAAAGGRNVGTEQKFISEADPLPTLWYAGGGYRLSKELLASAEVDVARDNGANFALGAEYRRFLARNLSGAVRMGFNSANTDPGGMSGLSFGLGLGYDGVAFDFAWLPAGELGDSFRYSLLVKF